MSELSALGLDPLGFDDTTMLAESPELPETGQFPATETPTNPSPHALPAPATDRLAVVQARLAELGDPIVRLRAAAASRDKLIHEHNAAKDAMDAQLSLENQVYFRTQELCNEQLEEVRLLNIELAKLLKAAEPV